MGALAPAAIQMERHMSDEHVEQIDTREKLRQLRHEVFMQKLREERRLQKLTQAQAADRVQLGRTNVSDAENGRSRDLFSLWDVTDGIGVLLETIISRTNREVEYRLREQGRKLSDFTFDAAED